MASPQTEDCATANLKLLTTGGFSDFTIRCQSVDFKVHKTLICPSSDFFRAACTSRFKEANENVLTLPEEDPDILAYALMFLYTKHYDINDDEVLRKLVPADESAAERSDLDTHVQVYLCSDRLGIQKLSEAASESAYHSIWTVMQLLCSSDLVKTSERMWAPPAGVKRLLELVIEKNDSTAFKAARLCAQYVDQHRLNECKQHDARYSEETRAMFDEAHYEAQLHRYRDTSQELLRIVKGMKVNCSDCGAIVDCASGDFKLSEYALTVRCVSCKIKSHCDWHRRTDDWGSS